MAVTEIVTHTLLQAATDRTMTRRRPRAVKHSSMK
jgi:hypothetical protein